MVLGACAIAVGISVLLFMPDSPGRAHFLSQEERIAAIERIRDEQVGTENKRLKKEQVIEALLDIRSWLIVLATLLSMSVTLIFVILFTEDMFTSQHSEWRSSELYGISILAAAELTVFFNLTVTNIIVRVSSLHSY